MPKHAVQPLSLVIEHKLFELMPGCTEATRLEASGVEIFGDRLLIVMDNLEEVARVPFQRNPLALGSGDFVGQQGVNGYEDIAHDPEDNRLFLLREAVPHGNAFAGEVIECNTQFERIRHTVLDFVLEDENKGFEGLAWTRRAGRAWLLALCEGNFCTSGKKGRTPGGGRIQAFALENGNWTRVRQIALPEDLPFEDYSALSMSGDRVGVVSQESSLLWVGDLSPDGWDWVTHGQLYEFPRNDKGNLQYLSVEGLAWLGPRRVVAVSDKSKKDQPPEAEAKDQSVHVFDLP
jgi:hypothetical protein